MLYLFPYGSTHYSNIETITDDITPIGDWADETPMLIFFDQEPVNINYNFTLFNYIIANFQPPFIFVTTEKDSDPVNQVSKSYNWPVVEYFHHIFAANDWFREYRFNYNILDNNPRQINKKFITFNRITGNSRVYRSLFVAELSKNNLLDYGHVSYSKVCPVHGTYQDNIYKAIQDNLISETYGLDVIKHLTNLSFDLRVDNKNLTDIPNDSMTLGPVDALLESFVYVVTETCFWEKKKHLTEKIFKPIVARQPFLLLGCANNLSYLREHGFKTFNHWWDESYDSIENPIDRLQAVVKILKDICSLSIDELQKLRQEMQSVLDHNFNLFYSEDFITNSWNDLTSKIKLALAQHKPRI